MAKSVPVGAESRPVSELTTEDLDALLASGERSDELAEFFGRDLFTDIQRAKPNRRAVRGGRRRVYILPGVMGSTLGSPGETLWINFRRIARGRLTELSLDQTPVQHEALDVVPYVYYFLRRRLMAEGFEPVYFPFDWRLDMEELGRRFAQAIIDDPADEVDVIGHSMGGLVARLAMRDPAAAAKVSRVVMMGTPNKGSFNAAQVFDGSHSITGMVQRLDLRHDMAQLIDGVFATLPGVYQLLPFRSQFDTSGVYDSAQWPTSPYAAPRQSELTRAEAVTNLYPAPDERYYLIASVAHETAIGIGVTPAGVEYQLQPASGDGTVPITSAVLAGVKTKLVDSDHMGLPKDGAALDTLVRVLRTAPAEWADDAAPRRLAGSTRTVSAAELRRTVAARSRPTVGAAERDAADMTPAEQRELLDEAFHPTPADGGATAALLGAAAPPDVTNFDLTGGRILERPRRRLEITLARGSLADAEERVGVVGLFQNVRPGGSAGAIDALAGGAIGDLLDRRMFDAQAGRLFILPTPTRRIGADLIVLLGLGKFEELTEPVYRFAAANLLRTLTRSRFRELATVVYAANSTVSAADGLRFLLRGFFDGLAEADPEHQFRRITVCEIDPARQEELKAALIGMATSGAFAGTEVVLNDVTLAPTAPPALARAGAAPGGGSRPAVAYLSVRGTIDKQTKKTTFAYSLLRSGGTAVVLSDSRAVPTKQLDDLLAQLQPERKDIGAIGRALSDALLPPSIRSALESDAFAGTQLTFVNDVIASRMPWEVLPGLEDGLAVAGGVSRLLETGDVSAAKWLENRRASPTLRVLLVIDPNNNLEGAVTEGEAIAKVLAKQRGVTVDRLTGDGATRAELLGRLASGQYDVIHFAGHAHFDPNDIDLSGIECSDGTLTGRDVAALSALPTLVVFNACESARVRGGPPTDTHSRLTRTVSFAEAFLMNGVAQFVGTYWPVGDAGAAVFGETFYTALSAGQPVGAAVVTGRRAVQAAGSPDWADYIHYGDPAFAVKLA